MTIGAVLDEAWTLHTRFYGRFLLGLVVFAIVDAHGEPAGAAAVET